MSRVSAFDYPNSNHVRRHGPTGYKDYESYRDWLRDEFSFRCVYCLKRETWGGLTGTFHLDHFRARSQNPRGVLEYDNLVYACATCNTVKSDLVVPDPCRVAFGQCVRVNDNGTIEALRPEGRALIRLLCLDDTDHIQFRQLILETLRALSRHSEKEVLHCWLRFPDNLPDLSTKHSPGNSRPNGIQQSHFARRARSELPEIY